MTYDLVGKLWHTQESKRNTKLKQVKKNLIDNNNYFALRSTANNLIRIVLLIL